MKKIITCGLLLLSCSVFAWQLPKKVVQDLDAAHVLVGQVAMYQKLVPMIRYALVQMTYQQVPLIQIAANFTEDELRLMYSTLTSSQSTMERGLDHLHAVAGQIEQLQSQYKRADRCRFRPRLDDILEEAFIITPLAELVQDAYRLHHLYFLAQKEIALSSGLTVVDESYHRSYHAARLSFMRDAIVERYPMLSAQLRNQIDRLAAPEDRAAYQHAEQDCVRELAALTAATKEQIKTMAQQTKAVQKKTRFASFVRRGVSGAVAVCTGLVSFGIFCAFELGKVAYKAATDSKKQLHYLQ